MDEFQTQEYVADGPVARIFFSRPEKRNATNIQFYDDLLACLDRAEADPAVRVIVLGGRGPVFCAGQDLTFTAEATPADFTRYLDRLNRAWDRIRRHPKPVIARVHGHAFGGGMHMLGRCDLIVMKRDAVMAMREIRAGEQSGGTHLLTVGKQRSMQINLLGQDIAADDAERWNLINVVVDTDEELDDQVDRWVEQLVALPPLGIAETKAAANFLLDAAGYGLHRNAPFGSVLRHTEDRLEAKRAWVEKRKPVFQGR